MHRRARFAWRGNTGCIGPRPVIRSLSPARTRVLNRPAPHAPPPSRKKPTPPQVKSLLDGFCPEPRQDEQLAVNSDGQMLFVCLSDIEWLEAADCGIKLHAGKHVHWLHVTLSAVLDKLPRGRFVLLSRSTLANVEHIQALQRLIFDEYEVVLRSGCRLPLARGYSAGLLPAKPSPAPLCHRARL